jgi:hypothetical protein
MRLALSAAIAAMLAISAATSLATEARTEDEPLCGGRAPLREVAQDEVYTFAEQCSLRRDFARPEPRRMPGGIGWARAPDAPTPSRKR